MGRSRSRIRARCSPPTRSRLSSRSRSRPGLGRLLPARGQPARTATGTRSTSTRRCGWVQLIVQRFDQGFFDFTKGPNHKDVAGLGRCGLLHAADEPVHPANRRRATCIHARRCRQRSGSSDSPDVASAKGHQPGATTSLAHSLIGRSRDRAFRPTHRSSDPGRPGGRRARGACSPAPTPTPSPVPPSATPALRVHGGGSRARSVRPGG